MPGTVPHIRQREAALEEAIGPHACGANAKGARRFQIPGKRVEDPIEPGEFLEVGGATDSVYWQSQPRCYPLHLTVRRHAEFGEQDRFR